MTIEELLDEKLILKEKIEKALNEFYNATAAFGWKCPIEGSFATTIHEIKSEWDDEVLARIYEPKVSFEPIEI